MDRNKKIVLGATAVGAAVLAAVLLQREREEPPVPPPLPPPDQGNLYGKVIDGATGSPLVGATISLNNEITIKSDWAGNYTFNNLEVTDYLVTVDKEGYEPFAQAVYVYRGNNEVNIALNKTEAPPPPPPLEPEFPVLEQAGLIIMGINGVPFKSVNSFSAILDHPVSTPSLRSVVLNCGSNTITFRSDEDIGLHIDLWPRPPSHWPYPYDDPPVYRAFWKAPMKCDPGKKCPPSDKFMYPPWAANIAINSCWGEGYWREGLYGGFFKWGILDDEGNWRGGSKFTIEGMLKVTTSGFGE